MSKKIPFLEKGDKIKIVSPAKGIEPALIFEAKEFWEKEGYVVELGEFCVGKYHYFSGTDEERKKDFQDALDDPEVKAIICARGGYGCVRIVDLINWSSFIRQPKWIVGFSDVTVFHQRIQRFGFDSIHATMPLNYKENTKEALQTMSDALSGKLETQSYAGNANNIEGSAKGRLLGGNLSIVYSLLGTDDQPDYSGSILFLEDLSEQLYHIDRMFFSLEKAGVLNQISALMIGSFTEMKDTEAGFGKSLEQLILDRVAFRKIPVAFDVPIGHINDNRAVVFGKEVSLIVSKNNVELSY